MVPDPEGIGFAQFSDFPQNKPVVQCEYLKAYETAAPQSTSINIRDLSVARPCWMLFCGYHGKNGIPGSIKINIAENQSRSSLRCRLIDEREWHNDNIT